MCYGRKYKETVRILWYVTLGMLALVVILAGSFNWRAQILSEELRLANISNTELMALVEKKTTKEDDTQYSEGGVGIGGSDSTEEQFAIFKKLRNLPGIDTNGLILPKQYTDEEVLDMQKRLDEEIERAEFLLNSRPRKKLGYLSPFEALAQELH